MSGEAGATAEGGKAGSPPEGVEGSADPEEIAEPKDISDLGRFVGAPPTVQSLALTGLFVLGLFYTLYFAKPVVLPLVLAALLNFLFSPIVRFLRRWHVPEAVGAAVVLIAFLGGAGYGAYRLSGPAADWVEKAPSTLERVEYRLRDIKRPVEQVSQAAQQVEEVTRVEGEEGTGQPTVSVESATWSDTLFSQTRQLVAGALILVVLLYFLLASGDLFLRKLVRVMPRMRDKRRAVEIARRVERDISRYLSTITAVNLILAASVSGAMALLGVPNPVLWGVLAGALNFIPYLGAVVTLAVLGVIGLTTFDTLGRSLLVPGSFAALNVLEAYFITPILLGKRLMLNTVVIFVGIIFWGWMWGIPGAILAVPILAAFKIFCDRIEPLRPVGEFLGR